MAARQRIWKLQGVYFLSEVADQLGLAHKTMRTWVRRGILPARRHGLHHSRWRVRWRDVHQLALRCQRRGVARMVRQGIVHGKRQGGAWRVAR